MPLETPVEMHVRAHAFAAAVALLALACSDKPRTQIMVGFATDMTAPGEIDLVRAEITRLPENVVLFARDWEVPGVPGQPFALPASLGVYADDGAPTIRITASAIRNDRFGGEPRSLVTRTAVLPMIREETLFLRMGLLWSCRDNADCPPERSSCVEGRCRAPEVDPRLLPAYTPGMEKTVACASGSQFIDTETKTPLLATSSCAPDESCSEGTCYKKAPGATEETFLVDGLVFDSEGKPLGDAFVTLTDGRTGIGLKLDEQTPRSAASGAFSARLTVPRVPTDPELRELVLTVARQGFAPQIVGVPLKRPVTSYNVPVLLTPLAERALDSGAATMISAEAGPIRSTIIVPRNTTVGHRLRYAVLDPHDMPARLAAAGGLATQARQPAGVFYFELVDATGAVQDQLPLSVQVAGYPLRPVPGAQTAQVTRLDAQGQWRPEGAPTSMSEAVSFTAAKNGHWALSRLVTTACARGRVVSKSGQSCSGTRVRALGDQGIGGFDATSESGAFCVAGGAGQTSSLFVAALRRNVYMPATPGSCSDERACIDLGTVEVDDCNASAVSVPGKLAIGAACLDANKCGPAATCYQGVCISDARVRVSLAWSGRSDFDLHVLTPSGAELGADSPEAIDGRLDFQQCRVSCGDGNHVENVVLDPTARGAISFWVENEDGQAAGPFKLEVTRDGRAIEVVEGSLPATKGAASERTTLRLD